MFQPQTINDVAAELAAYRRAENQMRRKALEVASALVPYVRRHKSGRVVLDDGTEYLIAHVREGILAQRLQQDENAGVLDATVADTPTVCLKKLLTDLPELVRKLDLEEQPINGGRRETILHPKLGRVSLRGT